MKIRCANCMNLYEADFGVCPECGTVETIEPKEVYHLRPGTLLANRYYIGLAIGFGGFGTTYMAYDTMLSIKVAVKEFFPLGLVNRSPGESQVGTFMGDRKADFDRLLELFQKEAKYMAFFAKEKGIVQVYDCFEENNTAYIIMEYMDGFLLKSYLKEKGKLPPEEAIELMSMICKSVEKVHDKNMIHRDISPDNIFMRPDGTITLFDFGAAKLDTGKIEENADSVIKIGYAPPEQYTVQMVPTKKMDIYALGAILYEMVTGVHPIEASQRLEKDPLPRPSKTGTHLESYLEKSIMKAMAVKPQLRFETVAEFESAILNKQECDYPEDELKKIYKKRKLLGVLMGGAAAVALVVMILFMTILSPQTTLADMEIQKDEIQVWVMQTPSSEKDYKQIKEAFQKDYPQLTVSFQSIPKEEYEAQLKQAEQNHTLPTVFCTDLEDLETLKTIAAPLRLLTQSMEEERYAIMPKQNVYQVPTSFTVDTVYVNMVALNALSEEQKLKAFDAEQVAQALANVPAVIGEDNEENRRKFGKDELAYLVSDSSALRDIQQLTPGYYEVQPIYTGDEVQVKPQGEYAVNASATENQKQAGMVFISFLLSNYSQNINCIQADMGMPVNSESLQQYLTINPDWKKLSEYQLVEKKDS